MDLVFLFAFILTFDIKESECNLNFCIYFQLPLANQISSIWGVLIENISSVVNRLIVLNPPIKHIELYAYIILSIFVERHQTLDMNLRTERTHIRKSYATICLWYVVERNCACEGEAQREAWYGRIKNHQFVPEFADIAKYEAVQLAFR